MNERELRAQLDRLKAELSRMQQENDRAIAELREKSRRELAGLKQQSDAALARNTVESRRQLEQLREQTAAAQRRQREELSRAIAESERQRDEIIRQLKETLAQLRSELQQLKQEQREHDEKAKALANESIAGAHRTDRQISELPLEFFRPGQHDVIGADLRSSEEWLSRRFYEAALSMSEVADQQLQLLGLQVQRDESQWEQYFNAYAEAVDALSAALSAFREATITTPIEECLPDDDCRDFFASGSFKPLARDIEAAEELVAGIRKRGIRGYLNGEGAMRRSELLGRINELDRLEDRLQAVRTAVERELYYSDEREQLGSRLRGYVEDSLFYSVDEAGFEGNNDPLRAWRLRCRLSGCTITLRIVPIRGDGVAQRNELLLETERGRFTTEGERLRFLREWAARVQSTVGRRAGTGEAAELVQLREEQMRPDVEAMVRALEKKYQTHYMN